MLNGLNRIKVLGISLFTSALVIAAIFGYRCPAQGCPACRIVGH